MRLDDQAAIPEQTRALYADVIVPRHITRTFTYLVPAAMGSSLAVGHRVLVPFGRSTVEGAVVSLSDRPPNGIAPVAFKEIQSLAEGAESREIPPLLFDLSRKIARQYVAPWGQCLRLIFSVDPLPSPTGLRCLITEQGRSAIEAGLCSDDLRPTLARIARRPRGVLCSTLCQSNEQARRAAVETLATRGWISVTATERGQQRGFVGVVRPIGADAPSVAARIESLPAAAHLEPDPTWITDIAGRLRSGGAGKMVLHAPWEHRLSWLTGAIQQAQVANKSVLVLVGEVAKAEWLRERLTALTRTRISLLHPSSRADASMRAEGRGASVIVGTRSAVLTSLRSTGLIWMEGEDDAAFKEPQEPRYHARDVAWMRAEAEHALLVLASAHPSLEAICDVEVESYTRLPEVLDPTTVELVDLQKERTDMLLSRKLVEAMREALAHRTGVLLFLNRKGYAGALLCRECGRVSRCTSCGVALTYFQEGSRLLCRYCGVRTVSPDSCPNCRAARWSPLGEGTERAEAEARRLFPEARVARIDGDQLRQAAKARRLWEGIKTGTWDILIGTQALFQREPIPRRGVVGILQADSGLNVPDFRAAERTYHWLVDAAAVARPATEGGRVIVQTRLPDHHSVQALVSGEANRFYREEIAARRLLNYPPACHVASLLISGKDREAVERAAGKWKQTLDQSCRDRDSLTVLGPVPTMGMRQRGQHRYQILVKGKDRVELCDLLHQSVQLMEQEHPRREIKFVVDVDPVEMM